MNTIQSNYNVSVYQPTKPIKQQEPTQPAGGNIENRKPPAEPAQPIQMQKISSPTTGNRIDISG
jgi:hypothetical protein